MAIGDGIRRNVATVSQEERDRLRNAFVKLKKEKFFPGGVSYWDMQEEIHKNAHAGGADVHDGPAFLPWHRELCNRLEGLLREVDQELSLHYWDWQEDPRASSDGQGGTVNLLTPNFMGGDGNGIRADVGDPFADFDSTEPSRDKIWRSLPRMGPQGQPRPPRIPADADIITAGNGSLQDEQFAALLQVLQRNAHDAAHGYIGGTIGQQHFSFHDPFVFLLHSNVDRLWAMWQTEGPAWRLDPNQTYGNLSNAPSILDQLQPWAGGEGLIPWTDQFPWEIEDYKTSRNDSVVNPPNYDKLPASILPPIRTLVRYVSLQSFNYRSLFIRHRDYQGEISPISTALDRRDGSFRMVQGLSDPLHVSFEATNYPRYYLRQENSELKLQRYTDDVQFRADATFRIVPGLSNSSWSSFEAHNNPGHYIRHKHSKLYVNDEQKGDIFFKEDATFLQIGSLMP